MTGAAVLCLVAGCARPAGRIVIKGSDTMVALGQLLAEEFMKAHPDIIVSVTGGGSGTGITALIQGSCDIAQASRQIKQREIEAARKAGCEPVEHIVAWDGIAVIVHPSNPVERLTLEQLSDIYQGKVEEWSQVGGEGGRIVILARETSSGTHVFFKECVLQLDGERPDADYTTKAILSTSNQAIHDEVASNPRAIGYVGIAYVDEAVKAVAVAKSPQGPSVLPSVEEIRARRYPIARPLFMYTDGEPTGPVKMFLDFAMSAKGQQVVQEVGFVPVPEAETGAGPAAEERPQADRPAEE